PNRLHPQLRAPRRSPCSRRTRHTHGHRAAAGGPCCCPCGQDQSFQVAYGAPEIAVHGRAEEQRPIQRARQANRSQIVSAANNLEALLEADRLSRARRAGTLCARVNKMYGPVQTALCQRRSVLAGEASVAGMALAHRSGMDRSLELRRARLETFTSAS